eukprot:jgi/Chrzof1/10692/Cz05g09010.t1
MQDIAIDAILTEMHNDAEKFDPRTETVFKFLQVLSACAMSFAHGANDVANSIGSFSAAYYVYQNLKVRAHTVQLLVYVSDLHVAHVCQQLFLLVAVLW